MKRNLVTAFFSIIGSRVLLISSSVVLTPAIIHFAGKSVYGEYGTLMSAWALAIILMNEGVTSGVRKYISEERPDADWKEKVFGYYLRLAGLLALLTALAFVAAAYFNVVEAVWSDLDASYFYLLAPLAFVAQFRGYVRQTLLGLKKEHIAEPVRVLDKVSFAAAAIAITYVGYGVAGIVVGRIIGSLVTGLIASAFLARHISFRSVLEIPDRDFPRWELFTFNSNTVVYTFMLMSLYHIDILMLGAMRDSEQVAYYKAGLVITQFLWFAPRSLQALMLQSTSNLWAQGRLDRIEQLTARLTRYLILLTVLMAVGMYALADEFVLVYLGEGMLPTVTPLLLLLPGVIGFAVARLLLSVSHAKGDMRMLILATGASAVLNFALNAIFIPQYGLIGAAVATSIGYGSLAFTQVYAANRLGYRPFSDARVPRIAVTALTSAIPIFLLEGAIESNLLSLLVVPVVGFAVYSALAVAVGAIGLPEMFEIVDAMPGPIQSRSAALQRRLGIATDGGRAKHDPLDPWGASDDERASNTLGRVRLTLGAGALATIVGVVALTGVPSL